MSKDITRRNFLKGTAATFAGITMLGMNSITFADAEVAEQATEQAVEQAVQQHASLNPGEIPTTVIDRFVTKPGEGKEFLAWFMKNHAPFVEASALAHQRTLVFPAVWLKEESNSIDVIWEMQGSNMFWGFYTAMRSNPDWLAFWQEAKSRVLFHDRMFCGDAEKLEAMNNV